MRPRAGLACRVMLLTLGCLGRSHARVPTVGDDPMMCWDEAHPPAPGAPLPRAETWIVPEVDVVADPGSTPILAWSSRAKPTQGSPFILESRTWRSLGPVGDGSFTVHQLVAAAGRLHAAGTHDAEPGFAVYERRADGWSRLGGPAERGTPAARSVALAVQGERLVVAFEQDVDGDGFSPPQVFVSEWSGSAWSVPEEAPVGAWAGRPKVAIGPDGAVWVAATRAQEVAVLRRNAAGWVETASIPAASDARVHWLQARGDASYLAWSSADLAAVEQWRDGHWRRLGTPVKGPAATEATFALDAQGSLVLAISGPEEDGASTLDVFRWSAEGWRVLIRGLARSDALLVFGNRTSIPLLSFDTEAHPVLAWAESDGSTHFARLRSCGPGERPRLEVRPALRGQRPRTVAEAAHLLVSKMDGAHKRRLLAMQNPELRRFKSDWAFCIRDGFGLWGNNRALLKSCRTRHPDDCSMEILDAVWHRLQRELSPEAKSWPATVAEAADQLVAKVDEPTRAQLRTTRPGHLILHPDAFGLDRGNDALLRSCGTRDAQACARMISDEALRRLRQEASSDVPNP